MKTSIRSTPSGAVITIVMLSLLGFCTHPLAAQKPNVKQLDRDADRARLEYLQKLDSLAKQYDDAGDTAKAKQTLRQILQLAPEVEEIKQRLNELEERVFDKQSLSADVDVESSWVSSGLLVQQGKPIRLAAEGDYKFIVKTTLGPDGFPTSNLDDELVPGFNCGALMGLVVTPPNPDTNEKPKPGTPFLIGAKAEVTPQTTGLLYMRVNVPTGTLSNGKLKVTVSGHVQRANPPS
ncbi:MAG: hypothetical protein KDA93_13825 [Planctomycetaceae bacterium]|nr:hypothetical protein [Planctomycetaceae bacterium]